MGWKHTNAQKAKLSDKDAAAYQYSYYTMVPDGFKLGKTQTHAKFPVIMDSGSTLTYMPPGERSRPLDSVWILTPHLDVAAMVNNAFSTPAQYLWFCKYPLVYFLRSAEPPT